MAKYKSTLSARVKGMIEWQLEHYRENKIELEQYWLNMIPSPTPNYSGEPVSGGEVSRKTEDVVMRITQSTYIQQMQRSCNAIDFVLKSLNPIDKKLVDLVYWRRSHTPEGAGLLLHMGRSTVYRHINKILEDVAAEMGYISKDF